MTADSINTTATVTIEKAETGFAITAVHLDLTAKIAGADRQAFETAAQRQDRLSGLEGTERRNHDGRQARDVTGDKWMRAFQKTPR